MTGGKNIRLCFSELCESRAPPERMRNGKLILRTDALNASDTPFRVWVLQMEDKETFITFLLLYLNLRRSCSSRAADDLNKPLLWFRGGPEKIRTQSLQRRGRRMEGEERERERERRGMEEEREVGEVWREGERGGKTQKAEGPFSFQPSRIRVHLQTDHQEDLYLYFLPNVNFPFLFLLDSTY